jgi:hypothetical protein
MRRIELARALAAMAAAHLEENFMIAELFGYNASTKNVAGPGAWEDATQGLQVTSGLSGCSSMSRAERATPAAAPTAEEPTASSAATIRQPPMFKEEH